MINISLYKAIRRNYQPKRADILQWLRQSLINKYKHIYINISIVNSITSQTLNNQYRQKNTPTNVISLEYADTRDEFAMLSGELILCDEVIVQEAMLQQKSIFEHYAHMIIHGLLHIQGLDHINTQEAEYMENLEVKILQKFDIKNPYIVNEC